MAIAPSRLEFEIGPPAMIRSFFYGLLVLIAADSVWLTCLYLEVLPEAGILVAYVSPFFAAAITAYLAPRKRDLMGMLIALPAAASMIAVPMINGAMGGAVDYIGTAGVFVVSYWYLFKSLILCGIGSSIGSALARRRLDRTTWNESI